MEFVITTYCKIKGNTVWCNGEKLFSGTGGSAADLLKEVYKFTEMNYPKFHKMDNLSKLGILAAEICFKNSDFLKNNDLENTAIILSNHASSLDTDRIHQHSIADKDQYLPSPAIFVYTLPNIVIGEIAIKHKITGENAFLVSDRFDAETLVNYTRQLLKTEMASAALCGWIDYDGSDYEAFIYLVEIQRDSIKSVNFKALNQTIVNQLYQH